MTGLQRARERLRFPGTEGHGKPYSMRGSRFCADAPGLASAAHHQQRRAVSRDRNCVLQN